MPTNIETKSKRGRPKKTSLPETPAGKVEALAALMSQVSKTHGAGSLMMMGDSPRTDIKVISSGSLGIDHALGIGGYPRGRIVEIYGQPATGKSSVTLHAIAECQKAGGIAAFIDAEHAMDLGYAKKLGVDTDNLLFSQPDYGEQALDIVEDIVKANIVDLIVVDSVSALTPKAELDGNMEKSHMGRQARMMSQALRKLTAVVHKTNTCLIFINQVRTKINVMFGDPTTTSGGNALKFYCSVRIALYKQKAIKIGDEVVGNGCRVKIVKNKLAPPMRETYVNIIFGKGIDREGDILDMAVERGIVEKAAAWYRYKGDPLGNGKPAATLFLEENPKVAKEIEDRVRKELTQTT